MLLKVPIIYFNCDITAVISTVGNIFCTIRKVSNLPVSILTEFTGIREPGYSSSQAGLVAKFSLKSTLTGFLCFLQSGDKAILPCPCPTPHPSLHSLGHWAGRTLCKREGDYFCFAGLADEEQESPAHPASRELAEGLRGTGGRGQQHPGQQWHCLRAPIALGWHWGLPGSLKAALCPAVLLWVCVLWGHTPRPLGSRTVTSSARIVRGQGTELQAQLWLRSFPHALSAWAVLQGCPCHPASLTNMGCRSGGLLGAGNTWWMSPVLNSVDFFEAAASFCLSWPHFHRVTHVYPQSLLAKAAKLLKLFFSILAAWLCLWGFRNPLNDSILRDQW